MLPKLSDLIKLFILRNKYKIVEDNYLLVTKIA